MTIISLECVGEKWIKSLQIWISAEESQGAEKYAAPDVVGCQNGRNLVLMR